MAGEAPALSHAFHANLFKLAQSGGALVWTCYPTGHPPWFIQECASVDCQHRTICQAVQPTQARVRLDSNCRFDPSKGRTSMQSYFWDATLSRQDVARRKSSDRSEGACDQGSGRVHFTFQQPSASHGGKDSVVWASSSRDSFQRARRGDGSREDAD